MDLGVTVQPTTGALLPGADRTTAEGPRCARGGAWPEGSSSPGAKCRPRFPAGKLGALLSIKNVKLPACKAGVAIPMQNVAEIRAWRLVDALRVARDLPGPARCRSPPRGPAGCTVAASFPRRARQPARPRRGDPDRLGGSEVPRPGSHTVPGSLGRVPPGGGEAAAWPCLWPAVWGVHSTSLLLIFTLG